MINVKKAFYYAWRFTYLSDSMDYAQEEFNYESAKPLKHNPDLLGVNKFNAEYSPEIEEILSDPVTLGSSFFALPNKFEPDDKSIEAKIRRIGWNVLGWEDTKPLWLNIIRAPFSLIKNLVMFVIFFPLNILRTVSELLPLFLSNLCDQARDLNFAEGKLDRSKFFDYLGGLCKVLHFIGRSATSPTENPRFYFISAYNLYRRGLIKDAAIMLLCVTVSCLFTSGFLAALNGVLLSVGVAHLTAIISTRLMILLIPLVNIGKAVFRRVGKWWREVMNEPPALEDEPAYIPVPNNAIEIPMENQNQCEQQKAYEKWIAQKNWQDVEFVYHQYADVTVFGEGQSSTNKSTSIDNEVELRPRYIG